MWKWFRKQSVTSRTLIIIAICAAIGIVVRWSYVSGEVAEAFGGLFRQKP